MASAVTNIWRTTANLNASASAQSDWLDVSRYSTLYIMRAMTGVSATYDLKADWSDTGDGPGQTPVIITTVTYSVNDVSLLDTNVREIPVMAPYVRFKVTNTGIGAMGSHVTNVSGVRL